MSEEDADEWDLYDSDDEEERSLTGGSDVDKYNQLTWGLGEMAWWTFDHEMMAEAFGVS